MTHDGALTKSSLGKWKKALKGKSIALFDFTTCTITELRENIESYNECFSQVSQCLLAYVSTINDFNFDSTVNVACLFDIPLFDKDRGFPREGASFLCC